MNWRMAWRNLWRHKRRTWITASAIGTGLAMFILTFAYAEGFMQYAVDSTAAAFLGDAQIRHTEYAKTRDVVLTLPKHQELAQEANATTGVVGVTPRLYSTGLAAMGDRNKGVEIVGLDPQTEPTVTALREKIVRGEFLSSPKHALIGQKLAQDLELDVGDKLVVTASDAQTGDLHSVLLRISGVFVTRQAQLDKSAVLMVLSEAQRITGLGNRVHELVLKVDVDIRDASAIDSVIAGLSGETYTATPWHTSQPQLASSMELTYTWIWIFVLIVFSIAALGIVNTLTMAFYERFHEFGVMRALGTSPLRLAMLMLLEAHWLGVLGCGVGLVLGLGLYAPLSVTGYPMGSTEFYGLTFEDSIPFILHAKDVVLLALLFWILTTLTGLGAARRAARISPIEALRHV